jgi:pyridoxamine 5'-phosphate oxidase
MPAASARASSEPLPPDPIERFRELLAAAEAVGRDRLPEPTAFALATVSAEGRPGVRMLLLKGVDPPAAHEGGGKRSGLVFYTNVESQKGRELAAVARAAMCFHWQALERQVRIDGAVTRVSDAEADAYFATRPRASQIGAWASLQSRPIERPGDLEARVARYEREFAGVAVSRPPQWSGYRLLPDRIEFWRNMPGRLHERHLYTWHDAGWVIETLYP